MKSHGFASLIVLTLAATQVSGVAEGDREQATETAGAACDGGAAEQPVGEKPSPDRDRAVNYCPLYLTFSMNDVYYYYCQVCDTTCNTYGGASDDDPHDFGHCEGCQGGTCDPIPVGTYMNSGEPGGPSKATRNSVPHLIALEAKQERFVPPRRGDPGDAEHPDGKLVKAQPWVRFILGSDRAVEVRDSQGRRKYFRLLALRSDPPEVDGTDYPVVKFYIGQQLATHPGGELDRGCILPGGDLRQHTIRVNGDDEDVVYTVLSYEEVSKPSADCP